MLKRSTNKVDLKRFVLLISSLPLWERHTLLGLGLRKSYQTSWDHTLRDSLVKFYIEVKGCSFSERPLRGVGLLYVLHLHFSLRWVSGTRDTVVDLSDRSKRLRSDTVLGARRGQVVHNSVVADTETGSDSRNGTADVRRHTGDRPVQRRSRVTEVGT